MKTRVDILAVELKEGVIRSKTGGPDKPYKNFICQCVCHLEKIQVGELVVSDKLLPDGPMPGPYIAEYGLNVNWQNKKLEGQLKSLTPAPGSPQVLAVGPVEGAKGKAADRAPA